MNAAMWLPIDEKTPKDKPILGWCVHDADPYWEIVGKRLTTYAAHCELGRVEDGPHVIEWGGAIDERTYEEPNAAVLPDWWFRRGSGFEEAANPTHYMLIPCLPGSSADDASHSD